MNNCGVLILEFILIHKFIIKSQECTFTHVQKYDYIMYINKLSYS